MKFGNVKLTQFLASLFTVFVIGLFILPPVTQASFFGYIKSIFTGEDEEVVAPPVTPPQTSPEALPISNKSTINYVATQPPTISESLLISTLKALLSQKQYADLLRGPSGPAGPIGPEGKGAPYFAPLGTPAFTNAIYPTPNYVPSTNNGQVVGSAAGFGSLGVQDLTATTANITGSATISSLSVTQSIAVPTGSFSTSATTPLISGSTQANGTLTLKGTTAIGNTSTNANIFFKTGDSAGTTAMTILNNGNIGINTSSPLRKLDVAGGGRFTGLTSSTLTGTADPTASTTLTGAGTLFSTEIIVGDRITINAETRTVTAIASDTSLTVDTAFSDTASASITKLPAIFVVRDLSNTLKMVVNDAGNIGIGTAAPTRQLEVRDSNNSNPQLRLSQSSSVWSELQTDASGDLRISANEGSGIENIRINDGNLWVCSGGSCGVTTPVTNGNLIVENSLILDNNFTLKQTGSTTVDMVDSGGNVMLEFDESSSP